MSKLKSSYVNHTGGAYGVDTYGCIVGRSLGFTNHIHYRPVGNERLSKRLRVLMLLPTVLNREELEHGRKEVNRLLNKNYKGGISADLHSRNYYQVINSDSVYCFSQKVGDRAVSGGTNTALQLAIELGKGAYVFDINTLTWFMFNDEVGALCEIKDIPILEQNYAIVGTRDVEDYHVKNNKTGEWGSRPNYLGKETELAVDEAIEKLYYTAIRGY